MKGKRLLSLLLCLVMVLSCLPFSVFAAFLEPTAGDVIDTSFKNSKYNLSIQVVDSEGQMISKGIKTSSAKFWKYSSGKLAEGTKNASNKSAIPIVGAFLCGSATKDEATYGYPVTATITPADGYSYKKVYGITNTSYDDAGNKATADAAVKDLTVTTDADGIITVKMAPGPETKCEPNASGDVCQLVLKLELEGNVDPEYQVSLYPVPGRTETSDALTQTRKSGEAVVFPDETTLLMYSQEYFSAAEVDVWYTKAPSKQKDGTYSYDSSAEFNPETKVTGKLELYAKPKVKAGAQLTARANLEMYAPLTDSNRNITTKLSNLLYTPAGNAETYDSAKTATQFWKLPVGSVWTADKIPARGNDRDVIKNSST